MGQEIVIGSNVQPRAGTTLEQLSASSFLGVRGVLLGRNGVRDKRRVRTMSFGPGGTK